MLHVQGRAGGTTPVGTPDERGGRAPGLDGTPNEGATDVRICDAFSEIEGSKRGTERDEC